MTKIKRRLLLTQSDQRLAGMVAAGHEPAFEALVYRYRRPLLRYCRRLCLSEARAEEALQQTLLNAWVALRKENEVRDLRAWLYRVAHNAALNSMRGEQALSRSELALQEGLDAGDSEATTRSASLEDTLALRAALAGIAALPEMQREVMVRAAVAGQSHEEVASALGISDDAVRGLLYRARSTLRDGFTAITPPSLLLWAARGAETGAEPGPQRLAELAAGGGAAGLAGLAAKGGAVAVTAGLAITGVMVGHHRHAAPSHRGSRVASARESAQAGAVRPPSRARAALGASAEEARGSVAVPHGRGAARDATPHGRRGGSRGARRDVSRAHRADPVVFRVSAAAPGRAGGAAPTEALFWHRSGGTSPDGRGGGPPSTSSASGPSQGWSPGEAHDGSGYGGDRPERQGERGAGWGRGWTPSQATAVGDQRDEAGQGEDPTQHEVRDAAEQPRDAPAGQESDGRRYGSQTAESQQHGQNSSGSPDGRRWMSR